MTLVPLGFKYDNENKFKPVVSSSTNSKRASLFCWLSNCSSNSWIWDQSDPQLDRLLLPITIKIIFNPNLMLLYDKLNVGLSDCSISFAIAFVAGKKTCAQPAAGRPLYELFCIFIFLQYFVSVIHVLTRTFWSHRVSLRNRQGPLNVCFITTRS